MRNNIIDDGKSDAESLDLGKLQRFPQARYNPKDIDSDSHITDDFTVRGSFVPGSRPYQERPPEINVRDSSSGLRQVKNIARAMSMKHKKKGITGSLLE